MPLSGVSGLDVCASVVRSLLTVLSRFWQHCRARTTTSFPRELEGSIALIETMAKVWNLAIAVTLMSTV